MDGDVQRSEILGTVDKFKTRGAARKEADRKLLEINERLTGIKVSGLCDRFTLAYKNQTLGIRPDTASTYRSFVKRVQADLGDRRVDELVKDLDAIETWVNGYRTLGTPDKVIPDHMAKGSRIVISSYVPEQLCVIVRRTRSKRFRERISSKSETLLRGQSTKGNVLVYQRKTSESKLMILARLLT
jgi:hypothetical protein